MGWLMTTVLIISVMLLLFTVVFIYIRRVDLRCEQLPGCIQKCQLSKKGCPTAGGNKKWDAATVAA